MNATIINIGNELLNGHSINTNAAFIAQQLTSIGVNVNEILVVKDDASDIKNAIKHSEYNSTLVITTGGLGPTNDDLTKKTISEYFDTHLVWNEDVWQNILKLFKHRNAKIPDINRTQAFVPQNAHIFKNRLGTAPAFMLQKAQFSLVALPGFADEAEVILKEEVIPFILQKFKLTSYLLKTYLFSSISESLLAEKLSEWETQFYKVGFSVAYLPQPGLIKFKLSCSELDSQKQLLLNKFKDFCHQELSDFFVSDIDLPISAILGNELKLQHKTLCTAESCTGGYIAHQITSVSGSSEYFKGSIVAYSNKVKVDVLKVNSDTLEQFGAVSEEVVTQMAKGALDLLKSDYSIAISGIAGPNGATPDKPVGTTWIAVSSKKQIITKKNIYGNDRIRNIKRASIEGMFMLLKMIRNNQNT